MKWTAKDYYHGHQDKDKLFPFRDKNKKKKQVAAPQQPQAAAAATTTTKKTKKLRRVVRKEIVKTRRKLPKRPPQKVRERKVKPPRTIRVRTERKIVQKTRVKRERTKKPKERKVGDGFAKKKDSNDRESPSQTPVSDIIIVKTPSNRNIKDNGTAKDAKDNPASDTSSTGEESSTASATKSDAVKTNDVALESIVDLPKKEKDSADVGEPSPETANTTDPTRCTAPKEPTSDKSRNVVAANKTRTKSPTPPPPPAKSSASPLREPTNLNRKQPRTVLTEERKRKCYMWYARLGQPNRRKMKERVRTLLKSNDIDITVEEVEQLPWIGGGSMLSVKEMNKLFLSRDTDIVTTKERTYNDE